MILIQFYLKLECFRTPCYDMLCYPDLVIGVGHGSWVQIQELDSQFQGGLNYNFELGFFKANFPVLIGKVRLRSCTHTWVARVRNQGTAQRTGCGGVAPGCVLGAPPGVFPYFSGGIRQGDTGGAVFVIFESTKKVVIGFCFLLNNLYVSVDH